MNKSTLVVLVLAAALTAGLYSLPKVVVQNDSRQLGNRTTPAAGVRSSTTDSLNAAANIGATDSPRPDARDAQHTATLTPAQQQRLQSLRQRFLGAPTNSQRNATADQLITFFRSVSKYDSAAYYADVVARQEPTEANVLRAADQYYEAYGFAVDERKAAALGERTRALYQQALAKNPALLAAKANMAMTYVNTETPMQGIMLLREVLQQDPTNELALFNMGLLSMRSGQHTRAVERFRQILVNNPANRKAQFYLAVSLVESGQKAEARKVLAQVKATERDPQILAAVQELEQQVQ